MSIEAALRAGALPPSPPVMEAKPFTVNDVRYQVLPFRGVTLIQREGYIPIIAHWTGKEWSERQPRVFQTWVFDTASELSGWRSRRAVDRDYRPKFGGTRNLRNLVWTACTFAGCSMRETGRLTRFSQATVCVGVKKGKATYNGTNNSKVFCDKWRSMVDELSELIKQEIEMGDFVEIAPQL